jgi:hypothetical protein
MRSGRDSPRIEFSIVPLELAGLRSGILATLTDTLVGLSPEVMHSAAGVPHLSGPSSADVKLSFHETLQRCHNAMNTHSELLTNLASLATIAGFSVVIYAAIVAGHQLREMTRSRHLEAMLKVYEMLNAEAARNARRYVYTHLRDKAPEAITAEDRHNAERVTIVLDQMARLVESRLVPSDELLAGHADMIIRVWNVLQPHICYHRSLIGETHAEHFERLMNLAEAYNARHHPERVVGPPVDL